MQLTSTNCSESISMSCMYIQVVFLKGASLDRAPPICASHMYMVHRIIYDIHGLGPIG